jgi:ribonuclease VapC
VIVDSSALLAILRKEPEAAKLTAAVLAAESRLISTGTFLEAAMVAEGRRGLSGAGDLDALVAELDLQVVPFTADHVVLAREAFRRYGKGRGHAARLNFGDCFAYSLAKAEGERCCSKAGTLRRRTLLSPSTDALHRSPLRHA